MAQTNDTARQEEVRTKVRESYGRLAGAQAEGCCGPAEPCGGSAEVIAGALGYTLEELTALPDGANMGLSCGNPVALATLRSGEVVVDLGSGGGFDVFLAGPRVGPSGRAIGVDMTPEMIAKARRNTLAYRERTGLDNVEFRLGEIEHLPLADASVDVVISNCVLNLSPDKPQVWRDISRVLRPGGRVAVSDILLKKPLPPEIAGDAQALVGCVAGAISLEDTRAAMEAAGLSDIEFEEKPSYVQAMKETKDPLAKKVMAAIPPGEDVADYIASMNVTGRKPTAGN